VDVRFRPVRPGDEEVLRAIFASTRERELAAFPVALASSFVEQQFAFQRSHFETAYPQADDALILDSSGEPVGRLLVAAQGDDLYVAELAILTAHRRQGFGRAAMRSVQTTATGTGAAVRLHVEHERAPAIALYEGLGFVAEEHDELRRAMVWRPSA
jgi:ribosomal protein S18 acetylase RimI-like enzyme